MRVTNTLKYTLAERDIYGSKRIGADFTPMQLIGALPVSMIDTFGRYLGMKQYEMDNHLGNVLTTVSDRKIPISYDTTTGSDIDHYEADVLSSQDYYPFGWYMPHRQFSSSAYRFGYQSSLKDEEIYGAGNAYTTKNRELDDRLEIWWSIDPVVHPDQSPYLSMGDNPIWYSDIMGNSPAGGPPGEGDDEDDEDDGGFGSGSHVEGYESPYQAYGREFAESSLKSEPEKDDDIVANSSLYNKAHNVFEAPVEGLTNPYDKMEENSGNPVVHKLDELDVKDAAKNKGKGTLNPKVVSLIENGKEAHRDLKNKVLNKPGWQSEPSLTDPLTGKTVKPDALTPSGNPIELKPNTVSGVKKGQSQIRKYERATGKPGRVITYDPKKYQK